MLYSLTVQVKFLGYYVRTMLYGELFFYGISSLNTGSKVLMWKSTYAARNDSGGETKTHLNKKEFRGPRKTFRTVPVYEEDSGTKRKTVYPFNGENTQKISREFVSRQKHLWSSNYTLKFRY